MNNLDRRAFLHGATLSLAALPHLTRAAFAARAPIALRLGLVEGAAANKPRRAGIDVGVSEANHAGTLFGGGVTMHAVPITSLANATGVDALLGAGSREDCLTIARAAAVHRALFMNIGCRDDALRGADCGRMMFHVAPSDAMLRDAMAMANAGSSARAVAWDPSLEKFGADTLNGRFEAQTGVAMNEDAWLAWVAVKILWEAALRGQSTDAAKLATHLTRDTTQFDGHKGRPLSFRQWDHQLRQPVYVIAGDRARPVEVPPVRDDEASRQALDRLGVTAVRSACHLT